MTTSVFRHQLECLGWKSWEKAIRFDNDRWCVAVYSCGHTILALADSRKEVWSAAWSMAFKLTFNGHARALDT
jgi:hypothetical protein